VLLCMPRRVLSHKNCAFVRGNLVPYLINGSLGSSECKSQKAARLIQPFLHSSWQSVAILYNGPPLPLKIAASHGGSWPPSNAWFLGPARAHNSNSIWIGSAVFWLSGFCRAHNCDRQTDRLHYSVCNNRLHLRMYYDGPNNDGHISISP